MQLKVMHLIHCSQPDELHGRMKQEPKKVYLYSFSQPLPGPLLMEKFSCTLDNVVAKALC